MGIHRHDRKVGNPATVRARIPFSDHLAGVTKVHTCGYINPNGSLVLQPPPGEKNCVATGAEFSEGFASWKIGAKYGYVDPSGKVVIKPQFDWAYPFSEGLAAVKIDGGVGFIDKAGKLVVKVKGLKHAESFHHGLAFVTTKDGRYGYIDRSGKYVWTPTLLYND